MCVCVGVPARVIVWIRNDYELRVGDDGGPFLFPHVLQRDRERERTEKKEQMLTPYINYTTITLG